MILFITLYLSTFIVFLAIDFVGLSYVVKPVFERHIGHLLIADFRVLPAFAFYAFFMAVLLWFVSWPAIAQDKSLLWIVANGALIGGLGYGTYEFTNYAILKEWHWQMVWIDTLWGISLTAVSATAGVLITRAIVG